MNHDHDTLWAAIGKTAAWLAALAGSISLAQVQQVLGLVATSLVIVGSGLSLYTAWKRKAWRDQPKDGK